MCRILLRYSNALASENVSGEEVESLYRKFNSMVCNMIALRHCIENLLIDK
jgi:hypothetical protein